VYMYIYICVCVCTHRLSFYVRPVIFSKSLFARYPRGGNVSVSTSFLKPCTFTACCRCSSMSVSGHCDPGPDVHGQILLRYRWRHHVHVRRKLEDQRRSRVEVLETRQMVEFHTDVRVQKRHPADIVNPRGFCRLHRG
jgi:hypothetical protein